MRIPIQRHAAIMPMFAVLLPVMLILCFIAMNLSYMQLTNTELKIATDAAARAGGRALSGSQDLEAAREFAARAAELNLVSGRPLILSTDETDGQIVFGSSIRPDDSSRYQFEAFSDASIVGGMDPSGIQIFAEQPTNLLFKVANISSFNPTATSVATQIDRDMALVIDRSGSMGWSAGGDTPNKSRWEVLEQAMAIFFQTLRETDQKEQISISSFNHRVRRNLSLTKDTVAAERKLKSLRPIGGTAVGDGILQGMKTLTASGARTFAVKSIIVFTDGVSNRGTDPVVAAAKVLETDPDTIIHTVTFSDEADKESMESLATMANGKHYHADNSDELKEVFREIAATLPTIVTQ